MLSILQIGWHFQLQGHMGGNDVIYSLEDDDRVREMILYALKQFGFEAEGFSMPSLFFEAIAQKRPKLVLLDLMLPQEDGISVLNKLKAREDTQEIPVILLTAKGAEMEKVLGLDSGADDYVTKPFSVMELISRVKALLRRTKENKETQMLAMHGMVLDEAQHSLKVQGDQVVLTCKEFELLAYLMRHPGIALNREKLLLAVWDVGYAGGTRTVDVHVQTLRQKLGTAGKYIETVRGVGYRMGRQDET